MFEFVNHILNYSLTMPRNTMSLKKEIEKLENELEKQKRFNNDINTNPITKRWEKRKNVKKSLLKQKNKLKPVSANKTENISIGRSIYFQEEMRKKDEEILQLKSKIIYKGNEWVDIAKDLVRYTQSLNDTILSARYKGRSKKIEMYSEWIRDKIFKLRYELTGIRDIKNFAHYHDPEKEFVFNYKNIM